MRVVIADNTDIVTRKIRMVDVGEAIARHLAVLIDIQFSDMPLVWPLLLSLVLTSHPLHLFFALLSLTARLRHGGPHLPLNRIAPQPALGRKVIEVGVRLHRSQPKKEDLI